MTVGHAGQPGCAPSAETLRRNLRALAVRSVRAAEAVRIATPRTDLTFAVADDGAITASEGDGVSARWLASRRRPLEEAERLAATVDPRASGGVAVLGFGVGHHVAALARRMGTAGFVVCFEPDPGLLRAVLERVDCSAWLGGGTVAVLTDCDPVALSHALSGVEGILSLGVKIVEHPGSKARLGAQAARFGEELARVMRAMRTTVVTTLVQMETTLRNLLMNLDYYAGCPGVGDLAGACADRPAVVVSAGPSLRRNIDLLARPGVRDRVVVIAVQTVLKQLLERGIRPHFVTALDWHEISRRFYEGLTADDVRGVTLVADAKGNPAILSSFPGAIRCPSEPVLDSVLGSAHRHDPAALPAGATVAHLAYYLARHLGCDPVMLIGQDLAFTDGQYYGPGAAIHAVWAGEINEFNTLEMLEWQRIVRHRRLLHRVEDAEGRPVYTDDQMAAYLVQFERAFEEDARRGLTTIDATEGGARKRHTTPLSLAEALDRYSGAGARRVALPPAERDEGALRRGASVAAERARALRRGVWRVGEISRETARLLAEMRDHHADQARVNQLIGRVQGLAREVESLGAAYELVQRLNQTGTLRRFRHDREIGLDTALSPLDRQRRQIERDIENVTWLADAADAMGRMLDDTTAAMEGGPKVTRTPAPEPDGVRVSRDSVRVAAVVAVDPDRSGLGTPRRLEDRFLGGLNPLALLLRQLARTQRVRRVVLLAQDPARVRAIAGAAPTGVDLAVRRVEHHPLGERRHAVGRARLWARSCWRGGLANQTCYDEAFDAETLAGVMRDEGIDAAVICGADWALLDPALADAVADRCLERPSEHRFTFTQSPPGLAPCVIERTLADEMASQAPGAGPIASMGGLLGYVPVAPVLDPIAKDVCVHVEPIVRDAGVRFIPDEPSRALALSRLAASCGVPWDEADAAALCRAAEASPLSLAGPAPQVLTLEICTGRRTGGLRARTLWGSGEAPERRPISLDMARRILAQFGRLRQDAAVTLAGAGDPLMHPAWPEIAAIARECGIAGVHLRTNLLCDPSVVDALARSGVDVVSVDLLATEAEAYRRMAGANLFEGAQENVRRLVAIASEGGRWGSPWVVPRITRCDAVYGQVESFYDHWLMHAWACVIDPLARPISGDRIAPLPLPVAARDRLDRTTMTVLCDGRVPMSGSDLHARQRAGDLARQPFEEVWRALARARRLSSPRRAVA